MLITTSEIMAGRKVLELQYVTLPTLTTALTDQVFEAIRSSALVANTRVTVALVLIC